MASPEARTGGSRGRLMGGWLVVAAVVAVSAPLALYFGSRRSDFREAAMRMRSQNQLKGLAYAMLHYQEIHGRLPPHAVYAEGGRPLLSWRVLLLPYIEQENL